MNEHDIRVYAAWCNDGTADLYIECREHDKVLYSDSRSLTWAEVNSLVNEYLEMA